MMSFIIKQEHTITNSSVNYSLFTNTISQGIQIEIETQLDFELDNYKRLNSYEKT